MKNSPSISSINVYNLESNFHVLYISAASESMGFSFIRSFESFLQAIVFIVLPTDQFPLKLKYDFFLFIFSHVVFNEKKQNFMD